MTPSEEVKNKLDIVEIIREYISLKPSGRNFQALCPFHNEKTPSFLVSPDKQIWHCFGCNKGGDVFTFVMEKEGLTFGEALRLLAGKAGVSLPEYSPELASQKNRLLDILENAAAYYHRALLESPSAEPARHYLAERGLTEEVIDDWQIGFSPDSWDDLINHLKSKGFNERDILDAGLAVQQSGGHRYFNRFRGRIMFPLSDVNANIVGFTARVLPANEGKDGMGKYVNSPQGQLYDKSRILFGLHRAKTAIREQDYVIIVEGQMDAIAAHQFGFKNVVASSGTALTEDQVRLLERFTDNLLFALDADVAGQLATNRVSESIMAKDVKMVEAEDRFGKLHHYIDPAKSFKKNIKVALMPSGKDPDEAIRRDRSGWIRALAEAKPLMQYYFDNALAGLDLAAADGKRAAAKNLLPLIGRLPNPVEKDFWLKKLSGAIDVDVKFLYEVLPAASQPAGMAADQPAAADSLMAPAGREAILSEFLLALICKFPAFLNYLFDQVLPEHLAGEASQQIYKNLILYYNQNAANQDGSLGIFVLNYQDFRDWLGANNATVAARQLDKLMILGEREFEAYDEATANLEIKHIAKILKRSYLNGRLKELAKLIGELEAQQAAKAELDGLMRELNNLTQELRKILE
jgi:DNA primase